MLYPKEYLNNVTEITTAFLEKNDLKGVILDVDNTLIDFNKKLLDGVEDWIKLQKQNGVKFCIVSNSNKTEKVKKVADTLKIPFIYFAKKPLKSGFKKAKKILQLEEKNIAVVGDQIMTDVIGANRCHMFSILVKPIEEKDYFITRVKRPLEKRIIQKYLKNKNSSRETKERK